jgi:putative ABC transport system permease protein
MAIDIGASSAIFSFVNSILLQPLPFHEPEHLYIIESVKGGETGRISQREITDIKESTSLFDDIAGYNPAAQYNLTGQGEPEEIATTICSSNLFSVLGVGFVQGKSWPEEFDGRRAFGIVLTEDLWKRKFDGDASHINGTITLDAYTGYTVFGVVPSAFDFPKGIHMFRSASWFDAQASDRNFRDRIGLGRLRKDVDPSVVQQKLNELAQQLSNKYPETNGAVAFTIKPLSDLYVGGIRPYLWLLIAAVAMVLLIACVNVSNLILSVGAERDKEVAIRTVMGAPRIMLIRQFLLESLLLTFLGGALGLVLTWGLVAAFKDVLQADLPHWLSIRVDTHVILYTLIVSSVIGVIAGLMPSLKLSGTNIGNLSKENKGTSGGHHRHRIRKALVVAELSLSIILLVGTGLLLKSLHNLQRQQLGFNADETLTYRVALPWRKYGDMQQIHPFYKSLLAELKSIPGVKSAALNDNLPLSCEASEENRDSEFTVDGQSFAEQKENPYVKYQTISGDYLTMMEIKLEEGRFLTDYDDTLSTPVAVISKTLAKKLFPKGDVLNKRVKFGKPDSESVYRTIVGVVGDVRHGDMRKAESYHIYLSCWQRPEPNQFIVIKTDGNPVEFIQVASAAVWKIDGDQSLYDLKTMQQRVDDKLWQDKLVSQLFSLFAGIAILLAAIGVYSVMSYAISQRTKELGVRRVLGAATLQIVWMVQKEVLMLAAVSLAIGIGAAVFVSGYISQFMFEVNTWDTSVYTAVGCFLVLVAALAALIPAWRATLINPVKALKNE